MNAQCRNLCLPSSNMAVEATKNICCAKGEDTVDYRTVIKWVKKFHSCCKNLENQTRSSRPKTVDSEPVLQAIEANPASSIRRISSKLGISQSSMVCHLHVGGCPCGVMVKAMNCGIVVREFVLQSRYYVHFRANTLGKGMNPLILPPAMGK